MYNSNNKNKCWEGHMGIETFMYCCWECKMKQLVETSFGGASKLCRAEDI
jgi:hypothetical protein